MLDWLIRRGMVVDGSGKSGFVADVGVRGNRIVAVGNLSDESANQVFDASDLVIAPGFIDMHAHDDAALMADVSYTAKLTQGVTSVVVGNCGFSLAPAPDRQRLETLTFMLGIDDWQGVTFADYLAALDARLPIVNGAALVGHGAVRVAVIGFENRPANADEMNAMGAWVKEAMDAGAFGISTGLIYPPNSFSTPDEVVTLARVAAESSGFYASHIRGEADEVFDAVEEAIAVGERARLPVQISHVKLTGRKNWGRSMDYLKKIETARARGVDVAGDMYPYDAGCTGLSALLPNWAHEGGPQMLLNRLRQTEHREHLRRDLTDGVEGWWNPFLAVSTDDILLTYYPGALELEGKTLSAIAKDRNTDPIETVFDILIATEAQAIIVIFAFSDGDIRAFLRHPWIMIGTDGTPTVSLPHPRTYGTFARILGHYVRDERVLDLPEAIRKMTSLPAHRLGLKDRGIIQSGFAADLVAFDPTTIRDQATYLDPIHPPAGIHAVWVNGALTLRDGQLSGERAGRVLRRGH